MESNINEEKIEFTHLHVHTEYSLLDGSAKIKELALRCKELGMTSLAITDHGAMYGAIDFYKACNEQGIKPIIGCEVYVAPKSRFDKNNSESVSYYHLVLLAENNEGYDNLIKLVSFGFTEGFYYKPRVDEELLKKYHKGIIATSACLAGPIARTLLQVSYPKALETALRYQEIFGTGNFFLELQDHGIKEQKIVNEQLIRMSEETGIPLICSNDSHYIYESDANAHDILLCIQTAKTVNDENRMRYEGSQFYLKSPQEMLALFPNVPQALENTCKIAERCNVNFVFHELKLPKFDVPDGYNASEYLEKQCKEGFQKRYPNADDGLKKRLAYELETIETMGYVDYFLIVWDFIKYAKDNGIMVGPGRGSAAGSIVSYCLNITTIDPIKYDLIFERFLNPERVSMPDIDVDFCYERRQEVIDYVIRKYGEKNVAQIITFGTLAARAAIKDVGRAIAMPYAQVDMVSKMIPFEIGITIDKALAMNSQLNELYESDEEIKYLIDMSRRLEGLPRHASTHAAGVVICGRPVMDYVPLSSNDGAITTQYTMTTLEELGILKMDFLGLRTLTVIRDAVNEINRIYDIGLDIEKIGDDDPKVYELIAQGKTDGVFQLESSGMKQFMKELSPTRLDDLIAGISLYRPGPMDFIPKYVKGKNSGGNIQYTHELLEPILKNTYGCIVYQEQVMQIVRDLAGYSLGRSDLVRRAMSKKKTSVMAEERKNFVYGIEGHVPGCVAKGISPEIAEKIFDEMTDFAKYAFNKSHAAAYAVVGYETAWLKTYYPVEFMAALMTSVMDNTPKVSAYMEGCKKIGVDILPPDINEGFAHFSVSNGKIRFGLAAIKNVGRPAIASIVKERERGGQFRSMNDFCSRVQGGDLNKRCLESFVKAGAFDSLGGNRLQYMLIHKIVLDGVTQAKKNNLEGQLNLFDLGSDDDVSPSFEDNLPDVEEYPLKEKLAFEKEVLGIYISGHPLSEYMEVLKRKISCTSLDFSSELIAEGKSTVYDGTKVIVGGIIAEKNVKYTKNGQQMCIVRLEDMSGDIEVIIFSRAFEKYGRYLIQDKVILIEGRAAISDDEAKIFGEKIIPVEKEGIPPEPVSIGVVLGNKNEITLDEIMPILNRNKGDIPLYIHDVINGKKFKANRSNWVSITDDLMNCLTGILGDENVVVKYRKEKNP